MTFLSRREFLAGLAAASISGCKRLRGPLQFGQLDAIDGAIPRLAYTLGYFAKEGVDVVTTLDASGAAIVQQMTAITGALDLGVMGLPPLCSMIGQYQVRPAVIATVSGSDYTCQLLTFSDTGITDNPAALKHRPVGYTLNTVSQQYLSRLLARGGLTIADVRGFAGAQSALIDALIHGDLDAAVLWDPNIQLAIREYSYRLKNGATAVNRGRPAVFVDPSVLNVATHIVARSDAIQEKRPDLLRFLRALIDAETFLTLHRAAAQQSVAQWVNLSPGDLDHFFATSDFRVRLELGTLGSTLRGTMLWLKQQNSQTVVPSNISSFVDASLLRQVDSSRVTEA